MAVGRITQTLNISAINQQLHGPRGGVARSMLRRGLRVQGRARQRAPARTGRLRSSIEISTVPRVVSGVSTFGIVIGTNVNYAKWVINGTGIYGPSHAPIRPTHGTFLVFKSSRGPVIHARSVVGQRPNNFLKEALSAARGG